MGHSFQDRVFEWLLHERVAGAVPRKRAPRVYTREALDHLIQILRSSDHAPSGPEILKDMLKDAALEARGHSQKHMMKSAKAYTARLGMRLTYGPVRAKLRVPEQVLEQRQNFSALWSWALERYPWLIEKIAAVDEVVKDPWPHPKSEPLLILQAHGVGTQISADATNSSLPAHGKADRVMHMLLRRQRCDT